MSRALEVWKQVYGISDEAHFQLLKILQLHSIDGGAYDVQPGLIEHSQHTSVQSLPRNSRRDNSETMSLMSLENSPRQGEDASTRPCIRCWVRKTRCESRNEPTCAGCAYANIPRSLCSRVKLLEASVFAKWRRDTYRNQLAWDGLFLTEPSYVVDLQHYPQGPKLNISCATINTMDFEQTRLFHKTLDGWTSMETTAFALPVPLNDRVLQTYIESHTMLFLNLARDGSTWLDAVLRLASSQGEDPLVRDALHIWTAHRLLMQGWQMTAPGCLGMPLVTNIRSLLFDTTPAPRVLQNQLDHRLEHYCAVREEQYLKALQNTMLQQRRSKWNAIFISAVILLHVRERDIHRLLYWTLDTSNTYTWRHPDSARTLIGQSLHASDVLLGHLYFGGGLPSSLTGLKPYTRPNGSAKERYNWICEDSVDLSLCGLAFHTDLLHAFERLSINDFTR